MIKTPTPANDDLKTRVRQLGLYGILTRWEQYYDASWLPDLLACEETERQHRSLRRRIRNAHLGVFKTMTDFDWTWPKEIPRDLIEELGTLDFIATAVNVVLLGPNGIGKTMIAKNLAHQALRRGYTVRFTTASEMLNDLAAQDGSLALQRRLKHYCHPTLLCVDEVGYLSYDNRHADLLFEVVTRRYQQKPILLTTNKAFKEWNDVFPNAACVVTLVDRLVHKSEIVKIDGESYRLKEARERAAASKKRRRNVKPRSKKK